MNKKPTNRPDSKAATQRQLQVGELIRHALAEVFMEGKFHGGELSVPITVSEVRMTPDLRSAMVFVMPLGGTADKKSFLKALGRIAPGLRAMVAKKVNIRFSPELLFRIDDSFDRASHVEELLRSVKEEGKDLE